MLTYGDKKRTSVTFTRIRVDAAGKKSAEPILKCVSKNPDLLPSGRYTTCTFLYDSARDDGSYDFVMGLDFQRRTTWMLIVPDVVPPPPKSGRNNA